MNKIFTRVIGGALGLAMAVGVGIAITNTKKTSRVYADSYYEKATSIEEGDTVVLVYETGKVELSGISSTSTKYGLSTSYTTLPVGAYPLTVEEGNSEGTYAFKNGNNYLTWISGNSLNVASSLSANTSWTVSFSNGNATIANANDTSRVIKYNSGSPRFACYTSGQQSIQIYKLTTSEEGAVTGVSLDKTFEPVKLSTTLTLTETIEPADAINKNVSWASSNESVATVSDGVVTPVAKGNATITVTTEDGGKTASCVVIVTDHLGTVGDPFTTSDAILVQAASSGTTSSKYYVKGDVTEINIVEGGSCSGAITDGTSSIKLFTIYDEGTDSSAKFSDTSKIIVSDTIVVYSIIGIYSSTVQVQYGNLYSVTRNITLESVEIRGNITNAQYVGENWDVSELSVYAIYSNDEEIDVTSQVELVCNPVKPSTSGAQSFTVDATYNEKAATQRTFNVTVQKAVESVSDVLVAGDFVATNTNYKNFSNVSKTSKAVYSGNNAKSSEGYIQMRTNNSNSGIIVTSRGGKRIKSVSIVVGKSSPSVEIYGSNDAYTGEDASVLYGDNKGTLVATLTASSTTVSLQDNYKYVGIRSASGAIYLSSITIEWELYNSDDVASNIKTMAGGWSNNVSTENCNNHYKEAKEMVLLLSESELEVFKTAESGDVASARQTYEWWCQVNGDDSPYSGPIVQNARIAGNSLNTFANNSITAIIIISSISLVALGGFLVIRRKKEQ